ncbi:MAG: hypothetical protein GY838_00580, partial [bacterium]|nr:hypothetical protein [bacterium]
HAIGHFSDATTREITGQVTWSSDDATIATVSNADDEKGLANAVGENQSDDTATITAMFDTVSGTTELTVTDALLEAIEIAPYNPEIAKGQEQQFTAIGHYSDDSTQEITEQVTWTSSNPSVAVISNQDELSGLANGGAQGTSTISAALDEVTSSTILTVTTATLTSIEVLPPDAVVAAGTKVHFQAIGHFSDYTAHDITGLVSWESDDETAAIISNADGEKGMATGIALGTATITAAFEEVSGTADLEVTAALLQHIEVTPYSPSIPDGTKIEFTATGYYSDDTVQNITDQVQWTSSDTDVAVISNVDEEKGVAEGVDSGTTTIKAALGDEEATTVLTVTAATLTSIEVLPPDPDIAAGTKIQLHAIGHFSNSTVADLTPHVAWTSSDSAVAVISNAAGEHGQATAVAEGSATITAAFDEVSGTVSMTVSAALLDFIEVHPVSPSIPAGYEIQMVAIGHYSDHSVQEITDQVAWSSSDPTTAVASNADDAKGLTSALSAGTATITARFDSTTASTTITVTLATLDSIEVLPAETAIANGTHAWFDAIGHYSDSTARQITSEVSWSTSDETVALISNADGEKGFASSVAAGTTTITATHAASEVSGDATLVVTAATVTNIEVTPHHPSIANGTPAQFRAYAHFTDDTHQEVTGRAVWNTSNSAVAVVSNADDDRGLARAVGTGSATISASFGGQTGDTVLTVTAALLTRIEVTPFTPSIALGTHAWFNAIGHYSDNTVHDITHMVTWTSSSTSVAVISNAEEEKGLASSVALGTTTITASLDEDSGSTTLTVTNPTVTALEVTPHYPSIADGTSIQFNAYAHFSNGTHQDVTTRAAWSSDDGTVAVVSNVSGDEGVATGVAAGDATISAAF